MSTSWVTFQSSSLPLISTFSISLELHILAFWWLTWDLSCPALMSPSATVPTARARQKKEQKFWNDSKFTSCWWHFTFWCPSMIYFSEFSKSSLWVCPIPREKGSCLTPILPGIRASHYCLDTQMFKAKWINIQSSELAGTSQKCQGQVTHKTMEMSKIKKTKEVSLAIKGITIWRSW